MNLHNRVAANMEYIQTLFLDVQATMQKNIDSADWISVLDQEPLKFRSIAYEAASFEIGLQDLKNRTDFTNWKNFYQQSAKSHSFHIDIGLGWAFAKTETSPASYLENLKPVLPVMVFDGIGYYFGLFKGRRTVKNQMVPTGIQETALPGFDQGLGRRLWYISKGNVDELIALINLFPISRQTDLWRGVGIACGYVGGNDNNNLEKLCEAANEFTTSFRTGIMLAAISRVASGSVTPDIESAFEMICGARLDGELKTEEGLKKMASHQLNRYFVV